MADAKPEAAYFAEDNCDRTAYFSLDMTDSSQLPALAEPFFLAFNARLTVRPAMNLQDLMNAGPGIERAVKNYGRRFVTRFFVTFRLLPALYIARLTLPDRRSN